MNIYRDGELLVSNLNDIEELNGFWKRITKEISGEQKYIKIIKIDQIPMYDAYELYILQHFDSIESLDIITITANESLKESIEGLLQYSARVLEQLPDIYRSLYVDIERSNWEQLIALIEGMEWMVNAIEFSLILNEQTGEREELKPILEQFKCNLQKQFALMDQLLKDEDLIGFADVLQYEIEPLLIKFTQN
ncbi:hypothetical protein D3C73_943310 [compost metagenome]